MTSSEKLYFNNAQVTRKTSETIEIEHAQLHAMLCAVFGFAKHKGWIPGDATVLGNGQMADQFINEKMDHFPEEEEEEEEDE